MRASAAMQDRVLNHEKVEVHFNTGVADAYGDKKGLKGLHLKDTSTGAPTFSRGLGAKSIALKMFCQALQQGTLLHARALRGAGLMQRWSGVRPVLSERMSAQVRRESWR